MPKKGFKSGSQTKCEVCGKDIYLYPSQIKRGYKACSRVCRSQRISGVGNPNFGKLWTTKMRLVISKLNKGRKHTDETRKKVSEASKRNARFGIKNNLWKGGVSSFHNLERNSERFRNWRKRIFKRDNFTCVECGERGGELHAHHIKHFATHPKLRYNDDNGKTLCLKCHSNYHSSLKHFLRR